MPDELHILSYAFSGTATVSEDDDAASAKVESRQRGTRDEEDIRYLNERADAIAEDIQTKIRAHLPFTTVLAEVSFSKGSLLLTGTVTLLSWAGGIAFDTVKGELAEVIRINVKRVISRVLQSGPGLARMEIQVRPRAGTPTARQRARQAQPGIQSGYIIALLALTGAIFLLELLSIASRYVSLSIRP